MPATTLLPTGRHRLPSALATLLASVVLAACGGDDPVGPEPVETPTPTLSSVSPATVAEGSSFTLDGTDFSTSAAENVVTMDGVVASVTSATATRLTVIVPSFDCKPQRTVDVRVSRSGKASNTLSVGVQPAAFVDVAIGSLLLLADDADGCLQFPPAAAGAGAYVVGIGAAAELPDRLFGVTLSGETGEAAALAAMAGLAPSIGDVDLGGGPRRPTPRDAHLKRRPTAFDVDLPRGARSHGARTAWARSALDLVTAHGWRRGRVARLDPASLDPPGGGVFEARSPRQRTRAAGPPAVGDELSIQLPTFEATTFEGFCTPIPITTSVRVVGERAIFATDVANPAADPLTDAELAAFSDAFDAYVYDADTEHFGTPHDRDGNERILVVLTREINAAAGEALEDVAGVVNVLEHFDSATCPAANGGELLYMSVPDPDNGIEKAVYLEAFLPVLAHEFAHVIELSVRT